MLLLQAPYRVLRLLNKEQWNNVTASSPYMKLYVANSRLPRLRGRGIAEIGLEGAYGFRGLGFRVLGIWGFRCLGFRGLVFRV